MPPAPAPAAIQVSRGGPQQVPGPAPRTPSPRPAAAPISAPPHAPAVARPAASPVLPAPAPGRDSGRRAAAQGSSRRSPVGRGSTGAHPRAGTASGRQSRVGDRAASKATGLWIGIGAGGTVLVLLMIGLVAALSGPDVTPVVKPIDAAAPPGEEPGPEAPVAAPDGNLAKGSKTEAFFERVGKKLPGVGETGGRLFWTGRGETRIPIAGTRLANPVFETEIGTLEVDADLAEWAPPEMGPTLLALVATAKSAGLGAKKEGGDSGFSLDHDLLFGFHLSSNEIMVVVEGVARREELADRRVEDDMATLRKAISNFEGESERSILGSIGRAALLDLVKKLDERDGDESLDEVEPSFARKLVRRGWLTSLADLGTLPSAREVEKAVRDMMKLQPTVSYQGEGLQLVKSQDALGHRSWLLRTPDRTGYGVRVHLPHYHGKARQAFEAEGRLLVILPAGADPRKDDGFWEKAVEARLYHGRDLLVRWHRDEGFRADEAAWRRVATADGKGFVRNYLPPHIVLTDLQNDPCLLITALGNVAPPRDPSLAEAERFLSEAAKVLSDPAHLDLFGQHLFTYVYDSPDTTVPFLVGNRTHSGEIHQTAEESMATAVGGVCRGDCDDLSEVYVNLLRRQGKLAHVFGVPGHAAAGYAEKRSDGWHTFVLQTGPALEVVDATLPDSLKKLWDWFGAGDRFDPNAIEFLLRFGGENTRKSFSLGYRVFEDAAYANTMIDVQEDLHNGTYSQGIAKVEALIAGGDDQVSTYKEMSGLYESIGDSSRALEFEEKAYQKTTGAVERLQRALDLTALYFKSGERDKGRALGQEVLGKMLPGLERSVGPTQGLRICLTLFETLRGGAFDLAWDVLSKRLIPTMTALLARGASMIARGEIDRESWGHSAEAMLLGDYATAVVETLGAMPRDEANAAALDMLVEAVRPYYESLAIQDAAGQQNVMEPYSRIAAFYEVVYGAKELEDLVEKAAPPGSGAYDHWRRGGGDSQMRRDLPWIRISVAYWSAVLLREINAGTKGAIDAERIRRLHARMTEALETGRKIDALDSGNEYVAQLGDLLAALALQDESALRRYLQLVKRKNDRRLRDVTAHYLGAFAGVTPEEWYARVVQIWAEELDYKPRYFSIAWRAAAAKAKEQALLVARVASERFKDDPTFVAEYEFMKKHLGG